MKTYADVLRERRKILGNPYAYMDELTDMEALKLDRLRLENPYAHADDISKKAQSVQRFDSIAVSVKRPAKSKPSKRRSSAELEEFVRDVQLGLWKKRRELFGSDNVDPLAVLDPAVALKAYGFNVVALDSLGQFATSDGVFEVAGCIDKDRKLVQISTQFPTTVRAFTLAHEFGHALLHEATGLHRDRPLDGTTSMRDEDEREANRFATLFLMPAKQVRRAFEDMFGSVPVRFDERSTFRDKLPPHANVRRLAARRLASMTQYSGLSFFSLAERFHVSVEAMAIRLEELETFVLSNNLPA
jgi:Zn-dependent peptidase ImmA (M78 family)